MMQELSSMASFFSAFGSMAASLLVMWKAMEYIRKRDEDTITQRAEDRKDNERRDQKYEDLVDKVDAMMFRVEGTVTKGYLEYQQTIKVMFDLQKETIQTMAKIKDETTGSLQLMEQRTAAATQLMQAELAALRTDLKRIDDRITLTPNFAPKES